MTHRPTTTGDPAPLSPECQLWRAVLEQMIKDAKAARPSPERGEARRWFIVSRADVALVLEFADIDPEAAREGLETLIASWDAADEASRLINMRRRRGRPRKAVSVSPAPRAKPRRKANA
jgi:hypothetical protein